MGKKKRKHFYRKDPIGIRMASETVNVAEVALSLRPYKEKETLWLRFLSEYIDNNEGPSLPDDLRSVLLLVNSEANINLIINTLFSIDGYNPLTDSIPLEKLPEPIQKYISKKEKYILDMFDFKKKSDDVFLMFGKDDYEDLLKENNTVVFLLGENIYIHSNYPANTLEILEKEEPGVWAQKDNSIYNKKQTKINFTRNKGINLLKGALQKNGETAVGKDNSFVKS